MPSVLDTLQLTRYRTRLCFRVHRGVVIDQLVLPRMPPSWTRQLRVGDQDQRMRVGGRYKFLHAEEDVGRNRPYPELEFPAGDRSAIASEYPSGS
jgi:hypothetical protein